MRDPSSQPDPSLVASPGGAREQELRFANDPPHPHPRIRGRCPSCGAESLFLGSGGYVTCAVIGCKDPGAPHDLLQATVTAGGAREPQSREYTIRICDQCYVLEGEMCHNPECVFCRRTMAEVGEYLDVLLIRPVVDGERLDLHPLDGE